jgi:hypothetical protein
VNVTTRIVVPLNDWFEDVFDPLLQAATNTKRTTALARTRLISLYPLLLRKTPPAQHAEPPAYPMNMGFLAGSRHFVKREIAWTG